MGKGGWYRLVDLWEMENGEVEGGREIQGGVGSGDPDAESLLGCECTWGIENAPLHLKTLQNFAK